MARKMGLETGATQRFHGQQATEQAYAKMLESARGTSDFIVGFGRTRGGPGHWFRMTRTADGTYMPRDPQTGNVGAGSVMLPDMGSADDLE